MRPAGPAPNPIGVDGACPKLLLVAAGTLLGVEGTPNGPGAPLGVARPVGVAGTFRGVESPCGVEKPPYEGVARPLGVAAALSGA